jgi:conjugal transfer pilus assembly protein TraU
MLFFKKLIIALLLFPPLLCGREGKFINPFTDVCWECLFPITVSGINVTPDKSDQTDYSTLFCYCAALPPKIGIPLTFWEPLYLVDVTKHAYKLLGLGGISVGQESIKNRGSISLIADGPNQQSFYHVHFYTYPIIALLELFTDFVCAHKGDLEMGYMTELDPLWNDDQLSIILNAEAGLFSNPLAQIACIADCTASTLGKPQDALFWCAGCQGSLYPFTGTVGHHVGALQASSLLLHRMLAKLHRSFLLKGYENNEFCEAHYLPFIKKSLYKKQLVYPIPQTKGQCHPLGKTDAIWGIGKSFPCGGEDFVYLVWVKKQCCLDAVKPLSAVGGAP